jgi:PAS domain S-box-containing protein
MSKKEGFFRGILDSLQDGVYFVDMNRRITYWNKGAERIDGKKLLGQSACAYRRQRR